MLVLTLGDPYSINAELVAACHGELQALMASQPVVLVGQRQLATSQLAPLGVNIQDWRHVTAWPDVAENGLYFFDCQLDLPSEDAKALDSKDCGGVAWAALSSLKQLNTSPDNLPLAVITLPIDKPGAQAAGMPFPGQTEFFSELWQQAGIMILAGDRLRVGLATNHLPLAAVPGAITTELVLAKLEQLAASLPHFGETDGELAVCGLNPHAGDQGLFGHEDRDVIAPAIQQFNEQQSRWQAVGPVPADTAFYRAYQGQFAAVLAMYHDQGLGPLKLVHFDDGINLTGGLPHLRVSPDHGPARDLYGQGRASAASLRQCLTVAKRYLSAERD